ncbi:hypothetical protein SANTM175S_06253 [Streptomyces antimycoticus]
MKPCSRQSRLPALPGLAPAKRSGDTRGAGSERATASMVCSVQCALTRITATSSRQARTSAAHSDSAFSTASATSQASGSAYRDGIRLRTAVNCSREASPWPTTATSAVSGGQMAYDPKAGKAFMVSPQRPGRC